MDEQRDIDKSSTELRREIEETKSSLTGHLHSLEGGVKQGFDDVRDSLDDSVASLKDAFHVRNRVREHPAVAVGLSLLAGLALSQMRGRAEKSESAPSSAQRGQTLSRPSGRAAGGVIDFLGQHFGGELRELVVLAAGRLMGAVKERVKPDSVAGRIPAPLPGGLFQQNGKFSERDGAAFSGTTRMKVGQRSSARIDSEGSF